MPFEVLTIGLGDQVLGAATDDARLRHLRYAEGVDHLHMIVWSRRGLTRPETLSPRLTVYPAGQRGGAAFIRETLRIGADLIQRRAVSVVSVQDPFYTAATGLRLRRLGARLQVQSHSDYFGNPHWLAERPARNRVLTAFGRWAVRRADRLRVVNTTERQKYVSMGVAANRIDVLPVPVALDDFQAPVPPSTVQALRARWQIASESPVLLWVGRPVPFKDLGTLLRALAIVRAHRPDVRMIFGGDFGDSGTWPSVASGLGLSEVVRFVGPISRDELPDYFAACTVYLHSSIYEGFGRVMVEAGAAGRPVVATSTAGAQDIIRAEETGLLCPPSDPESFAQAILTLLSDEGRTRTMGEAAQRRVTQQFDAERLTRGIIAAWYATAGLDVVGDLAPGIERTMHFTG